MKRVTGIGGVFFKTPNVVSVKEWYRSHLGFHTSDWGASFMWGHADGQPGLGRTEWSPFPDGSDYFAPSVFPYMINYRVDDLNSLLEVLKKEGVKMAGDMQEYEYGKFGWIMDPEGRKIELWEPPKGVTEETPDVWNERITGLGGVFFKSTDAKTMTAWYKKHLDVSEVFHWKDLTKPDGAPPAATAWAIFKSESDYFSPSDKPWMFNYRVRNLVELLRQLKAEGVTIAGEIQTFSYGSFCWVLDPDGTKVELWEPKD